MLGWPTMVQNLIGGLQGVVDHALVGHFVGYAGNAAIGVGIQIFIVVIVFVMSVFSGMGVLVARVKDVKATRTNEKGPGNQFIMVDAGFIQSHAV